MSYKKRCKWIGTTLSATTYVAIKGQPYLLEGHKPDVGRPNSFGLSALITRKKTNFKLKCMRLEWARYVGFTVLWQEDYRLTMSRGTSFNKSNKTFSGACKTESEQKVLFVTAAIAALPWCETDLCVNLHWNGKYWQVVHLVCNATATVLAQSVERNTAEREVAGSISGAEPILRVFNEELPLYCKGLDLCVAPMTT